MYKQIISSTQVSAWTAGTPAVSVGTVQGCSIKLINQTQYELQVFNGTEQIDTVPPFSFIVSPYENDLNVSIDKSNASTVLVSPYQYVAFKRIKGMVSYQTGSTTFPGNTPVTGQVDITNTLNIGSVQSITDVVNNQVVNERLSVNDLIEVGVASTTINLAAGATMNLVMPTLSKAVQFDQVYLFVSSSNQQIPHYSFQLMSVELNNVGWQGTTNGQSYPLTFVQGSANTSIMMTWPLTVAPQIGSSVNISITNNYTAPINGDTVTVTVWVRLAVVNITNPASSPVPTQSQYTPTTYNLGNYTIGATVVPAQSTGASQSTGSVPMTNVTKAQLLVQQTASSGFLGNPSTGVGFQLEGSNDNSTWYTIVGDANNPTSMVIINNGFWNQAADQTSIPAIISGYAYIRWAIYLVNDTTASVTMSESCTVYMQTLEG